MSAKKRVHRILSLFIQLGFWVSFAGALILLFDLGFPQSEATETIYSFIYLSVIVAGFTATGLRYALDRSLFRRSALLFDLLYAFFILWVFIQHGFSWGSHLALLEEPYWLKVAVLLSFVREFSSRGFQVKRTLLNPAQLFIISFLAIIVIGAFLLVLPNATKGGISFLDALFTSTSAVCVTGLAVVDTGTHFTRFGQYIIMGLIQIGGLGILTFASYFSYFFRGGTTYETQLVLSDMTSSRKLGEVFSTLKHILIITFGIELAAGILIYTSLDQTSIQAPSERMFFAAFHAVSAFCNAGFSTLSNSLYETGFKFNYFLHIVIIFTFVLGGLGFPIVVNILTYLRYKIARLFVFTRRKLSFRPWVLNLNSRITLITTLSITAVSFVFFYILEYHNTLAEHQGLGKFITALFGATTPRTAGFNTIDSAAMTTPALILVMVLMWIGASPQSTGGGIKTSTFAIAILNILSLAKGKSRIEVYRREIADISVKRAFAIMVLSLVVIGTGTLLISVFDAQFDLMSIAFESFSAYSTVGLSLGLTGKLSDGSKLVLIAMMFIGRVSMLTLVIAVFRKVKQKNYRYPNEEITIN
jgi:trk system potassium uptake protein